MKTKHTQGNWTLKNSDKKDLHIRQGETGFVIAEVTTNISHFIGNQEEAEANAHLIAAAPELLKDHESDLTMLIELVHDLKKGIPRDVLYFLENLIVSKKAVIKKATNQ